MKARAETIRTGYIYAQKYRIKWVTTLLSASIQTIKTAARRKINDGILSLLPDFLLRLFCMIPLLLIFRTLSGNGENGIDLPQLQSYTWASFLLRDWLNIQTFLSGWNNDTGLFKCFLRPMGLIRSVVLETIGEQLPNLLLFSLPLALLSYPFGVNLAPKSWLFFPSLLLCILLGFAVDFLFACLALRLRVPWLCYVIRQAVSTVCSGSLIPFSLLPKGAAVFFRIQPFGSLAAAPLSLLSDGTNGGVILLLQIFWNLCCWPLALVLMRRMRERLVWGCE